MAVPDDPGRAALERRRRATERLLDELADSGALTGLPGEGAPLRDDDGDAAGDRWAAHHVMANERVLPAWADLGRELEARIERLVRRGRAHRSWLAARAELLGRTPGERVLAVARATAAEDERVRRAVAAEVAELNDLVHRYNASVPVPLLQRTPLDAARLLAGDRDAPA